MEERNTSKLIKEIKDNPASADSLLYPGKQLSAFDPSKLQIEVLPSGFPSFDDKSILKRGRGELIIIGARPSMGKSGLGFQLAMNVARWGKSHIISLEMDHESVAARQLSVLMNRPLDYIQSRAIPIEELEKARKVLSEHNCIIDDRAGLNVYQICDAVRMQNKKSKTDVVVVDYIQIIATDGSDYSRAIALGKVSGELKNLAKELRIPVVVLSQLNRGSEMRDSKTGKVKSETPDMSQLKESGQLEQDADIIILLHRPKDNPNAANVIVAKNRNGPTGEIKMRFAPAQCRFIDDKENELE